MSGQVFRVEWLPGTDLLSGRCHCGAPHTCQDPAAMWEWLLAHPEHPGTDERPGTGEHLTTEEHPGTGERLTTEEHPGTGERLTTEEHPGTGERLTTGAHLATEDRPTTEEGRTP